MGDLIWVGNTLIPRDVVILAVALMFLAPFAIVGIVKLISTSKEV